MKSIHQRPTAIRWRASAAFWAASFLFFLIYSAPHQVHHFFDQSSKADHHDADHEHQNTDRNSGSSSDSRCAFQISASRCHLGLAWQVAPALLPILVRPFIVFQAVDNDANFRLAAFHIRAPPLA
jgi:hypothetical protein